MTNNKAKSARTVYTVLLSALIVVIGLFLVLFCISIFRSGDKPFEREVIASYLSRLAIPSAVCFVAATFAPVFFEIFKTEDGTKKAVSKQDVYASLRRLSRKKDGKSNERIVSLRKKRLFSRILCAVLCALAFVPATVFLLLPTSFPGDDTSREVFSFALALLACSFCSAAIFLAFSFFDVRSVKEELDLLKKLDAATPNVGIKRAFPTLTVIRVAVLCVGVAFVVLGILNGGNNDVLGKAINICYECIGLG